MEMLAWPMKVERALAFTPAAIISEAKVWRHSWRVIRSSPALRQAVSARSWRFLGGDRSGNGNRVGITARGRSRLKLVDLAPRGGAGIHELAEADRGPRWSSTQGDQPC